MQYIPSFGVGTIGAQTSAFNVVDVYASPTDTVADSLQQLVVIHWIVADGDNSYSRYNKQKNYF